ncbi:MAG TPA: non-heme iron oxygenase ferredoxin subunit [Candidatus Sulfomarinibacteraceae bacterium]|nr:non-heme iron oxygenase ferredoxin subunit [Candidatus Sulfomarinibacteraceae bacterium]
MAEFVKVCNVDEIPEGERRWVEFEEETLVVFNVGGKFYAIADVCTHDGGPLEDGELDGYEVECPRHGARFDVRNGDAVRFPAVTPVPCYRTRVEDGALYVESPDEW